MDADGGGVIETFMCVEDAARAARCSVVALETAIRNGDVLAWSKWEYGAPLVYVARRSDGRLMALVEVDAVADELFAAGERVSPRWTEVRACLLAQDL